MLIHNFINNKKTIVFLLFPQNVKIEVSQISNFTKVVKLRFLHFYIPYIFLHLKIFKYIV